MTAIQDYDFTPRAVSIDTQVVPNLEERYAWVTISFYDANGTYIGCRKEYLGEERMYYFDNDNQQGAIDFVLQRLGIIQL